jgi:hypothetical protein
MRRPYDDPAMTSPGPYQSVSSLHVAMGIGEGVGGIHLSGVDNLIDSQSSQSLAGHPLGAPLQSGEGAGAALSPCRNSQAALRVARTTLKSALDVSNIIVIGHGDKAVQSYEVSPFRDSEDEDSDEEEKRSQKPIPQWAR